MNEGFQPSEPPTMKKRPGRPHKNPEDKPAKRAKTNNAGTVRRMARSADLLNDTLAHYLQIVRILENLSKGSRNSVMHALVERFGAG